VLWGSEDLGPARLLVTDRLDGASAAPYDTLNLGDHVGDDPAAVARNRASVAVEVGVGADRLQFMRQSHGARVAVVDGRQPAARAPDADAMVTTDPGVALAVLVADCAPVLLVSRSPAVVGVAHAGRRGMVAGVLPAALAAMADAGAAVSSVHARIGPAVCGACYEVPASLQDEVAAAVPAARAQSRRGRPALDVRAGLVEQLRGAGVASAEVDPACTVESPRLYSYRRDGVTGRFAGVAVLR